MAQRSFPVLTKDTQNPVVIPQEVFADAGIVANKTNEPTKNAAVINEKPVTQNPSTDNNSGNAAVAKSGKDGRQLPNPDGDKDKAKGKKTGIAKDDTQKTWLDILVSIIGALTGAKLDDREKSELAADLNSRSAGGKQATLKDGVESAKNISVDARGYNPINSMSNEHLAAATNAGRDVIRTQNQQVAAANIPQQAKQQGASAGQTV